VAAVVTSVTLDRSQPEYLGTFTPDIEPAIGDPDRNLRNAHEGMKATLSAWRECEREIDANPLLTEAGKAAEKARRAPEYEARLTPFEQITTSHAKEVAELEGKVSDLNMGTSSPQAEVRLVELRSWYGAQPKENKVSILREALETNNLELLHAIISANPAMRLVDPKVRAAIVGAIGERQHPKEVALLEIKRKRQEVARFGLTRVRELLHGATLSTPIRDRFIRGSN
jgi:hypothetical protein